MICLICSRCSPTAPPSSCGDISRSTIAPVTSWASGSFSGCAVSQVGSV
jgi:hypothetical protein